MSYSNEMAVNFFSALNADVLAFMHIPYGDEEGEFRAAHERDMDCKSPYLFVGVELEEL